MNWSFNGRGEHQTIIKCHYQSYSYRSLTGTTKTMSLPSHPFLICLKGIYYLLIYLLIYRHFVFIHFSIYEFIFPFIALLINLFKFCVLFSSFSMLYLYNSFQCDLVRNTNFTHSHELIFPAESPWQSCEIPQNMIKLSQIPALTEIPLNLWPKEQKGPQTQTVHNFPPPAC